MKRVKPRSSSRSGFQWVALIVLGTAIGGGVRIAAGDPKPATAPHFTNKSTDLGARQITGGVHETTQRDRRHPSRDFAGSESTLTAEQAMQVIEDPPRFKPDLKDWMIIEEPPARLPVIVAFSEVLGWDEVTAGQVSERIFDFAKWVRIHTHETATLTMDEPGIIEASLPGFGDELDKEIADLREQLLGVVGSSDFERLEGLGFFENLVERKNSDSRWTVRLVPLGRWSTTDSALFEISISQDGFEGKSVLTMEVDRDGGAFTEQLERFLPELVMLPPLDWSQEFERAIAANYPQSE